MLLLDTKELTALFDEIIIHKYTDMSTKNVKRLKINTFLECTYKYGQRDTCGLLLFTNSMPTAGENKMKCFFLDEYYVFRYTNIK